MENEKNSGNEHITTDLCNKSVVRSNEDIEKFV